MLTETEAQHKRRQLIEDGYCVIDDVLDGTLLDELSRAAARILDAEGELPESMKYFGSLIRCPYRAPAFARLLAWQPTLELLAAMGYGDVRWMGSFFLIDKPPDAPPLWWHQDWLWWDEPVSSEPRPMQVSLSYYLKDTTIENGCLRVIPGTHLRRHELHDVLLTHDEGAGSVPLEHPMFSEASDAVDLPVKAGALAMVDARLLHAAYANQTPLHRPMVLGWYLFDFDLFPARLKSAYTQEYTFQSPDWWEGDVGDPVKRLVVNGERSGPAAQRNRKPGVYLRRSGG